MTGSVFGGTEVWPTGGGGGGGDSGDGCNSGGSGSAQPPKSMGGVLCLHVSTTCAGIL